MNEIEKELTANFNNIKEDLEEWGKQVDAHIIQLLHKLESEFKIKIKPSYRLKDNKSLISKAFYRRKDYKNPLTDIEDKVGTRVVLMTTHDIKEASKLLQDSDVWNVKITKDLFELQEENPEVFSYQSIHLVVWPKVSNTLINGKEKILTCEIQIRTLLQHAYAEVSHDSAYKGPYKNDKELMRHLAKSMALMEATDDYFCSIFDMMLDEKRKYQNLLSELSRIFGALVNDFNPKGIDLEFTDVVFSLLDIRDIKIEQLEELLIKKNSLIKSALYKKELTIFNQPAILLVFYYFFKHRTFLKDQWPFQMKTLEIIFHSFNEAFEEF